MKVLWITNLLFPEASVKISGNTELKNSGGWMIGAANALIDHYEVNLAVATVSDKVKELTIIDGEKIKYFILPLGKGNMKYNKEYELYWKSVKDLFSPNIINIHGSEFSHGLAWVRANGSENVVVTIQGLPTIIKDYYYAGLTQLQIWDMCMYGLLPMIRRSGIDKYSIQSDNEIELIKNVHHIIGRTDWDKAHIWAINPKAKYYFCNETLRAEFYEGKWEYHRCRKHTIFISQIGKSIKGFHQLLKALPFVLNEYPDTKVIVAGNRIARGDSIINNLKNRYNRIARRMIQQKKMEGVFEFIGPQDEKGMKEYMLNSNVFVLSSSIENSPNTLGEAQILGVPCISSYVGGVPDMIPDSKCGQMYRFSEYTMLAYYICRAFEESKNYDNAEMRLVASQRHNASNNALRTIDIYKSILDKDNMQK